MIQPCQIVERQVIIFDMLIKLLVKLLLSRVLIFFSWLLRSWLRIHHQGQFRHFIHWHFLKFHKILGFLRLLMLGQNIMWRLWNSITLLLRHKFTSWLSLCFLILSRILELIIFMNWNPVFLILLDYWVK